MVLSSLWRKKTLTLTLRDWHQTWWFTPSSGVVTPNICHHDINSIMSGELSCWCASRTPFNHMRFQHNSCTSKVLLSLSCHPSVAYLPHRGVHLLLHLSALLLRHSICSIASGERTTQMPECHYQCSADVVWSERRRGKTLIMWEEQLSQWEEERQLSLCNLNRTACILFWLSACSPLCSMYVCIVKCIVCCLLCVLDFPLEQNTESCCPSNMDGRKTEISYFSKSNRNVLIQSSTCTLFLRKDIRTIKKK